MKDFISSNVKSIEISGIRKFYNKVAEVPDAISLTLGQPDFEVPYAIKDAMIKAIEENKTTYTSNNGLYELRSEISKYLSKLQIEYSPEEVCITVGGSEGILDVFGAVINPGDKVLVANPAYPAYESCVKLFGGEIINYNLNKDDFSLDLNELKSLIFNEKPKLLVLSYPSNPTGAILSKEDRDGLYKIINESEILVLSDEMYASLCFEEPYYSIGQYKDIKDKLILVGGFSKIFSMTGLRIGYVCANDILMANILKVHQYNVSCAPSISQYGACAGLKASMEDVEYMKNEFIKRRDYLYERLTYIGFEVNVPKGAFYMFPSIKKFGLKSEEFCEKLLKEGKVALVPGSAFGAKGEGYVRISYASRMETLKEATFRIEEFVKRNFK